MIYVSLRWTRTCIKTQRPASCLRGSGTEWREALCSERPSVFGHFMHNTCTETVWKQSRNHSQDKQKMQQPVCVKSLLFFSGRRTLPRSFMPQENLFQLVPSSRTRSYNGDSSLQYSDLRSLGRTDKSCQRGTAKCKSKVLQWRDRKEPFNPNI